ncbi:hypothetical protein AB0E77_33150 [Streptomyces sp. NPDC032940]|uniref:hypothetical protein n=1 Tax=Streptomyces sp. NPDC032940 TaxID=3155366 RepID=UPI0033D588FC
MKPLKAATNVAAGAAACALVFFGSQPAHAVTYSVAAYSANGASHGEGVYRYSQPGGACDYASYQASFNGSIADVRRFDTYGAALKVTYQRCIARASGSMGWEYHEEIIGYNGPSGTWPDRTTVSETWGDVKDVHFFTCNWNPSTGGVGTCARMTKQ